MKLAQIALAALAALCLAGCSVRLDWPEHRIEVAQRLDAAPGVDAAIVVIDQVELMACDASLAQRLLDLAIPSAYAHGEAGPTLLVPHLADQLNAAPSLIGTLEPPPGRWCAARVLVRAGSDELIGQAAGSMRGASAEVTMGQQVLRASATAERLIPLEPPLELGDDGAMSARLVLVWDVSGVAEAAASAGDDEVARGRAALGALVEDARLELEGAP